MFKIDAASIEKLQESMKNYAGNAEDIINEVLHEQAGTYIQDSIRRLMPVSSRDWAGKKPAAKTAKSLRNINSNLAVTVTTTPNYQYLYFPDDGTSTKKHAGNKQFFKSGADLVTDEIVNLCISRLTEDI